MGDSGSHLLLIMRQVPTKQKCGKTEVQRKWGKMRMTVRPVKRQTDRQTDRFLIV